MQLKRRSFLGGLFAPAIIRAPGLLMPIRPQIVLSRITQHWLSEIERSVPVLYNEEELQFMRKVFLEELSKSSQIPLRLLE